MKKFTRYILGGILFLSMAANVWQYVAHQNQVAQQAAILADLQGQLDTATQDLADATTTLSTLQQDHATLLADIARLQAEKEAANQQALEKPTPPPATSKPSTPPATSKPSGGTPNRRWFRGYWWWK